MVRKTLSTYCALCISRCGCLATLDDGKLVRVSADHDHPTGRAICVKAKTAPQLVTHPDRLTRPLLRTRPKGDPDPGWRPIDWNEALSIAGERLRAAGPESTAFAVTTPSGTAVADSFDWILRLVHIWGSPNLVFATENCNWHRDFSPSLTWGRSFGMPDYARTKTILLWGSNPAATWLAHAERIRAAQRRGANLIVVDPRRSGLASRADIWLAVKPGSDAALALGLIHLMLTKGGVDLDFLRLHSDAFSLCPDGECSILERLTERAAQWPPGRVASVTGVSEESLYRTATMIAEAKPVSLYTWAGTCQQQQATVTARCISLFYALTGSLGQPGGNRWFAKPRLNDIAAFDQVAPHLREKTLGIKERPLGPPSRGWITTRDLFRTIVSEQPYPIRALVAFGSNFLVSKPATQHAEDALAKLDFFIQSELFETPSTRWADLLLPAASCWERHGLQAGFFVDQAAEAHVQLRPALVRPPGEARSDTAIVFDLARVLGLSEDFFNGDEEAGLAHILAPSGLSVEALRSHQRGLTATNLDAKDQLPMITLWSEALARLGEDALPTWEPPERAPEFPFLLTSGKTVPYCHSQFHQIETLRKLEPEPVAELAPDVAAARNIRPGDIIVIRTSVGEVYFRATINSGLSAGTIWAHYGWWRADQNVNYNAVMDGECFDVVSGSNALRGIACDVVPTTSSIL